MAFFGDVNRHPIRGDDEDAEGDQRAKARIDALNSAYAPPVPHRVDPASEARRVAATATVQSATQTGMVANMRQAVEVALLVNLPDGIPVPVVTRMVVPMLDLSRLRPGAQVSVTIDPLIPTSVRVDSAQ